MYFLGTPTSAHPTGPPKVRFDAHGTSEGQYGALSVTHINFLGLTMIYGMESVVAASSLVGLGRVRALRPPLPSVRVKEPKYLHFFHLFST